MCEQQGLEAVRELHTPGRYVKSRLWKRVALELAGRPEPLYEGEVCIEDLQPYPCRTLRHAFPAEFPSKVTTHG